MITLAEAKELKYGDILVDNYGKRWKVNGMVKTWKREEGRIRIPLKHGLYSYDAITEADFEPVLFEDGSVRYACKLLSREEL
jgi:hypothetical protein